MPLSLSSHGIFSVPLLVWPQQYTIAVVAHIFEVCSEARIGVMLVGGTILRRVARSYFFLCLNDRFKRQSERKGGYGFIFSLYVFAYRFDWQTVLSELLFRLPLHCVLVTPV